MVRMKCSVKKHAVLLGLDISKQYLQRKAHYSDREVSSEKREHLNLPRVRNTFGAASAGAPTGLSTSKE